MFSAKVYLLSECANIAQVLKESLRYRYRNVEFYNECETRLAYFHRVIDETAESEQSRLYTLMGELGHLAVLIADIERSHLEEFSWPFAFALERISKSICEALFFFRADGGMSSYAVRPEGERPGIIDTRINSVVFPRALKDTVLLHAILGHEIGHAIIAAHPGKCAAFRATLVNSSPVAEPAALYAFCRGNGLVREEGPKGHLTKAARSWGDEFLCDMFGLLIMGPSFLTAFWSLLEIRSFKRQDPFVTSHPPFKSRIVALMHAARAFGFIFSERPAPDNLDGSTIEMDREFVTKASDWDASPFAVLDQAQIKRACIDLKDFVQPYASLSFPVPPADLIAQLLKLLRNDVPPSGGMALQDAHNGSIALAPSVTVDFRHVLLGGWLRWTESEQRDIQFFHHVNRLCSFAIMQQEGIVHWNDNVASPEPA